MLLSSTRSRWSEPISSMHRCLFAPPWARASRPFGGVPIILIGDLYQLPPVVTPDDRDIFRTYYPSPYFFDAHAWRDVALKVVELTQVWRQRDPACVDP